MTTKVATGLTLVAFAATGCSLAPSAADEARGGTAPPEEQRRTAVAASTPAPTPTDVEPGLEQFYQQQLEWKQCLSRSLQCAKLRVPIDYEQPDGKTIELALMRVQAKEPENRLGSLVINPGGPGGSGVQFASNAPVIFGAPVKARYDIVGFDPRGVAGSAPVECVSDREMDAFLAADASPDNPREKRELLALAEKFAKGCAEHTGELLAHVSTENVVRDLDVLRGALGDEQLNYMGASYGTYVGSLYADRFPQRVGRMVLDAGLDPELSAKDLGLGQAQGFELALDSFLRDCVSREDCPLGDNRKEAYATLEGLI
ncbi:MAG TPA: alpha/beta fold hydrolase, partial [Actinopolymorphaceae bacterium]